MQSIAGQHTFRSLRSTDLAVLCAALAGCPGSVAPRPDSALLADTSVPVDNIVSVDGTGPGDGSTGFEAEASSTFDAPLMDFGPAVDAGWPTDVNFPDSACNTLDPGPYVSPTRTLFNAGAPPNFTPIPEGNYDLVRVLDWSGTLTAPLAMRLRVTGSILEVVSVGFYQPVRATYTMTQEPQNYTSFNLTCGESSFIESRAGYWTTNTTFEVNVYGVEVPRGRLIFSRH